MRAESGSDAFPVHVRAPYVYFEQILPRPARPARFLDLCCGTGIHSIRPATIGYDVTGIDLSASAVAEARRLAEASGVSLRCRFFQGDALEFLAGQEPFDVIFCSGSLYYLDFNTALSLITGKLTRGGHFFCIETRRENALINNVRAVRQLYSKTRGRPYRDEQTMNDLLSDRQITALRQAFSRSEARHFDLLTLVGAVLAKAPVGITRRFHHAASRLDSVFLNSGVGSAMAFKVVVHGIQE